jgi:hypothetical protein
MTLIPQNQQSSQDNSKDLSAEINTLQETTAKDACGESSEGKKNKPLLNHFNNHPALKLVKDCKLINDLHGKPYIRLKPENAEVTYWMEIGSKKFLRHLRYLYIKENTNLDDMKKDVSEGIEMLKDIAAVECKPEPVFSRFAYAGDTVYLGLNDEKQQVVEITAKDWNVIRESPVPFIYPTKSLSIPAPIRGGSLNDFRELLNLDEKSFIFIVAWLLMALRGKGPYPLLNLIGPAGSAKTTLATMLRSIIDPVISPLTTKSKGVHDLNVVAANNAILSLNNVSNLSDEMSDTLCAISTEGGAANRSLYTDSGEASLDNYRPVIINGIAPVVIRGDLIDRTLFVYISRITQKKRRTEVAVMAEFEAKRAGILGALLDGVVSALKHFDIIQLDSLPRMADFAQWVSAAAIGMHGELDSFMSFYNTNQEDALGDSLEYSPTAQAILALMPNPGAWKGTASKLLKELKNKHDKNHGKLPNTAQKLSNELTRIEHLLATKNITLTRIRTSSERGITLTRTA